MQIYECDILFIKYQLVVIVQLINNHLYLILSLTDVQHVLITIRGENKIEKLSKLLFSYPEAPLLILTFLRLYTTNLKQCNLKMSAYLGSNDMGIL